VASDNKQVRKKKGNAASSVLVVAALAAAGGTGWFLWKYQARLEQETPAPVAVAEPIVEPVDTGPKNTSLTQLTELLPATPPPATPPPPKVIKPVRGDITIVGKTGTTASIAPPTAEDLAARDRERDRDRYRTYNPPPVNDGPRVYTPDDPNRYLPQAPLRSGRPRYYDYESGRFRRDDYDPTFQRRTTARSNGN
jgi:hypothetical protein